MALRPWQIQVGPCSHTRILPDIVLVLRLKQDPKYQVQGDNFHQEHSASKWKRKSSLYSCETQRRVPDLAQVSGVETNAAGDLETLLTGIVTTFRCMPREELFILRLLVSSGSWLLRFWYREIGSQTARLCEGRLSSLVQWPETCNPQS